MKNFLAVDTSCNYLTVTVGKDGRCHSVSVPDCAMQHARTLMKAIDEALHAVDLRPQDCDFFAAVVGAGSFTGIRIAISAMKGFALACNKPTLSVTSFDVAAYNALDVSDQGKRLCLVDALHDCYYACGYDGDKIIYPPAYLTEEEVLALTEEGYRLCACTPLAVGEKAALELFDPVKGLENAVVALSQKQDFCELTALYVRKSSAELNKA